jgi:hypothetical protein
MGYCITGKKKDAQAFKPILRIYMLGVKGGSKGIRYPVRFDRARSALRESDSI